MVFALSFDPAAGRTARSYCLHSVSVEEPYVNDCPGRNLCRQCAFQKFVIPEVILEVYPNTEPSFGDVIMEKEKGFTPGADPWLYSTPVRAGRKGGVGVIIGRFLIEPLVCVDGVYQAIGVRRVNRRCQGVMNLDMAIVGHRYGSRRRVIRLRNRR